MACSSCGQRKIIHQVRYKDGTVQRFASPGEAKAAAAKKPGAEYQQMQR